MLVRVEGDLLQGAHTAAHLISQSGTVERQSESVLPASYLLSELAVEPYGFKTPSVLKVCYLHLQLWTRERRGEFNADAEFPPVTRRAPDQPGPGPGRTCW